MLRCPRLPLVALLALAGAALLPPAAQASRTQLSLFQDDAGLLYSGDASRERTLDELRDLGVDTIRVSVRWNRYAPSPSSKSRPQFDATDPNAYPLGEVDAVVGGAAARGMTVLLTPIVPGPAWASRCSGSAARRRICDPSPAEYGRFVTALGRRYPGVGQWSFLNEANLGAWLTPQWRRRGGDWVRWSPHMYRGLVRAGADALAATGHGDDEILLGETAPLGRNSGARFKRSVAPVDFYRELFCLNARGRRLGGKAARVRGCGNYERLPVTGIAHHPYTRGAGERPRWRPGPRDITLSVISRLALWADRGARAGRVPRGLPIWFTEFGFQTNPPDRFAGTSLGNAARWLNESDWIAWRNPRIRSVAQYELRDERAPGAFQTGLRFAGGRAKPSLAAYRLPIWPVATRRSTKLWLQVRPQSRLGGPQTVTVQYRRGKGAWRDLRDYTVTDPRGFLYTSTRVRAKRWRFVWNGTRSRTASPAPR
jgi:hypothetical protein